MVVRRWLTPYEWGTPPIATVISSDRFITALALVLWTWTNLPVHLSLEMMIFVGVCYLHMCHLKPALLLALTPVFYVSVEAMLKKVCRPRMSLSEEEATFKSYSSEFGACCVVKCVSTDRIPPACPVCTEYQWWGLVQARRFSGSENATMTWCSSMLTDEKYRCASLKNVSLRTRLSAGLFTQPKSLQNVVYFFFFP